MVKLSTNNSFHIFHDFGRELTRLNAIRICCVAIKSIGYFLGFLYLSNAPSAFADTLKLKFGLYTAEKPSKLVRQFRPVLNEVENKYKELTGKPVAIKIVIVNNYVLGQDNLANGTVDFSRMGPASYIAVKRRSSGISVIAMESRRGKKSFYGIIAVPSDSSIQKLADLKGKRFAFGNESSTIGRYLSQWLLVQNGIRASDLADYKYLGRHDLVGTAIAAKKFDAGALKESTYNTLVAKGYNIRQIAMFENVTQPWIAAAHLPKKTIAEIRSSLLGITNASALKALKTGPFMKGSDMDYNPIREAISQNSKFFKGK